MLGTIERTIGRDANAGTNNNDVEAPSMTWEQLVARDPETALRHDRAILREEGASWFADLLTESQISFTDAKSAFDALVACEHGQLPEGVHAELWALTTSNDSRTADAARKVLHNWQHEREWVLADLEKNAG
jgi:hypothetical protein